MLKQEKINFRNFAVKLYDSSRESKNIVLLLHGFPAEPISSKTTEKNIDFASRITQDCHLDTCVMHYKGLGNSKYDSFSFIDSLNDSIDFAQLLLDQYEKISIFGHSWGGYIGLSLIKKFGFKQIDKAYFHAPFTKILNRKSMKTILELVSEEIPEIIKKRGIDFFLDEFESLKANNSLNLDDYTFFEPSRFLISQSKNDVEIPLEHTFEFIERNSLESCFRIVDTDHSLFENRELMLKTVSGFFKGAYV